jgi:hypothetical protein
MKTSLDPLLKGWAERSQPDAQTLRRLEDRVRCSFTVETASASEPSEADAGFHPWGQRLAAAAALILLLGAGWLLLGAPRDLPIQQAVRNGAAELAGYSSGQVEAWHAILDEVETLFAGQIRWVNLDDDGLRLGMAEAEGPRAIRQPRLAVRTVIMARDGTQTDWETVWASDVLTRAEEYVETASAGKETGGLELWVHQLPDGRFMVDSEIAWPQAGWIQSSESRILSAGRPEHILTQTISDREYRIYQTIEPLANGRG